MNKKKIQKLLNLLYLPVFRTTLYILADICKFNGEAVTVPEMDEWEGYDLLALEEEWDKARKNFPKSQA